jgi:hypothetical protein
MNAMAGHALNKEQELREGWLRRDVVRAAGKRNTLTANEG